MYYEKTTTTPNVHSTPAFCAIPKERCIIDLNDISTVDEESYDDGGHTWLAVRFKSPREPIYWYETTYDEMVDFLIRGGKNKEEAPE